MSEDLLSIIHNQRRNVVQHNVEFLKNKLYLEFGTCHGASMLEYYGLYKEFGIPSTFYGFDSFQGLPPEPTDTLSHSVWGPGDFSTNGNINPELLNKPDLKIVDGWFCDTLTDGIAEEFGDKKVGLLHIDCDIYTSTIEALEFIVKHKLLVDGTIVVYDDWGGWRQVGLSEEQQYDIGEGRAHREICEKYNLNFELIDKAIPSSEFYEIATFIYRA